jgi:hypothetical protein
MFGNFVGFVWATAGPWLGHGPNNFNKIQKRNTRHNTKTQQTKQRYNGVVALFDDLGTLMPYLGTNKVRPDCLQVFWEGILNWSRIWNRYPSHVDPPCRLWLRCSGSQVHCKSPQRFSLPVQFVSSHADLREDLDRQDHHVGRRGLGRRKTHKHKSIFPLYHGSTF